MEDPRSVKGIVKREVVRVITPGTVIASSLLSEKSNNFLACIAQVGQTHGLAVLDLTTAEFRAMEFEEVNLLIDELARLSPKELLISDKWSKKQAPLLEEIRTSVICAIHTKEDWHFDHAFTCDILLRHFSILSLDGFGLKGMTAAINAAGAILHYVREDLNLSVHHIKSLHPEKTCDYMQIDLSTQRHLELNALLQLIDETKTAMGGRLLKKWLTHPLLDPLAIEKRQRGIEELLPTLLFQTHLKEIRDLERLIMRLETGYLTPRDLNGLRLSLEHTLPIHTLLQSSSSDILNEIKDQFIDATPLIEHLKTALVDAPPLRLSDGEIFKSGYHEELDALRALKSDHNDWIAHYQTHLRELTQIKTLKVGYTKAFGFYIEVSRGQAGRIPNTFQRRQTLTNAERFITPELKEYEEKTLHAEERTLALEYELFQILRKEVLHYASGILTMAQAIAQLDALLSLSTIAKKYQWVKPTVDTGSLLEIEQGRHPLIEVKISAETFVPNDVLLNADSQRMYLITGPNMAGKSTFIRQVALIAILAQIGSYVPAKRTHSGIIDKVFSRIGASDDLSRGQSTFMVEMTETANILNNATPRSLIILDEIGRGTSTYDGISIAWAVAEYLLTEPNKKAKTLFATHYWELTELEKEIPGAVNFNVAVHESEEGITFLRKIVKGGTDKSYGIHVAKLAGLPLPVLKKAKEMLLKLEKSGGRTKRKAPEESHPSLFTLLETEPPPPFLKELKTLDPNQLTPLEALQKIIAWKNQCPSLPAH